MAEVREATTIFVQGFGELFNQAKIDVQGWQSILYLSTRELLTMLFDLPRTVSSLADQSFLI